MATMYLTADDVQMLNAHFVVPGKLRDFGLLEGAVLRPQTSVFGADAYPTIHDKAALRLYPGTVGLTVDPTLAFVSGRSG
ncbi:MAG: hypothetical protein K2Q25_15180 [Mycobacteriaceae bacterium]|nr:hypothetical protein [Mycobacteriaceae bacterium]